MSTHLDNTDVVNFVLRQLPPSQVAALQQSENACSHNDSGEPPGPRRILISFRGDVLRVDVRQMVHKENGEDALRERLPRMPFHL